MSVLRNFIRECAIVYFTKSSTAIVITLTPYKVLSHQILPVMAPLHQRPILDCTWLL